MKHYIAPEQTGLSVHNVSIAVKLRYFNCAFVRRFVYAMLITPKVDVFHPVECTLPLSLTPWMTYEGSLTKRLETKAGNSCLQMLEQVWELSDWWDKYVLNLESECVLRREILMCAFDEPCWYARTIIPQTTYEAEPLFFSRLRNESLGALIFNETKVTRVGMIHYPISVDSIEYHWLHRWMDCKAEIVWVRHSTFMVEGGFPFFLIEIMLPGLLRYPN